MEHSPDASFENTRLKDTGSNSKRWLLFGKPYPKSEIVLLTVIAVSIYNLTKGNANSNLTTAL